MEKNWRNKKKSIWNNEGKSLEWVKSIEKITNDLRRIIKIIITKRLNKYDEINTRKWEN